MNGSTKQADGLPLSIADREFLQVELGTPEPLPQAVLWRMQDLRKEDDDARELALQVTSSRSRSASSSDSFPNSTTSHQDQRHERRECKRVKVDDDGDGKPDRTVRKCK